MKGGTVLGIAVLIVIGAMLADAVTHPAGTNAVFNGLGGLWRTGINGVLGKAS